jgi:hypothetical protein
MPDRVPLEPLNDVEKLLSMLRFDSREKLKDMGFETGTETIK